MPVSSYYMSKSNSLPPLHLAVRAGTVAEYLANDSFDPRELNFTDNHRRTALHLAAHAGDLDSVNRLIAAKSDVHRMAEDGFTALHFASLAGKADVVGALLRSKANVNGFVLEGNQEPTSASSAEGSCGHC